MTFSPKSLARQAQIAVGNASGASNLNMISEFDYATDDAAATVETAGYFNGARALLTVGTIVTAIMAVGGGAPVCKTYVVLTVPAAPANVTIGLQTTTAG